MLLGSLRKLTGEWLVPCYRSRCTSTERLREYTADLVHFEVSHDVCLGHRVMFERSLEDLSSLLFISSLRYNNEAEGYW